MKKIIGILMLVAVILLCAFNVNVNNDNANKSEIISIHNLTVKPGTDLKEFETFVMSEVAPIYKRMKGQDFFLGKGYVGQRAGEYCIFITFETVEDRNNLYPLSGGFSETFLKEFKAIDDDALWDKFNSMASGFDGMHCSDYLTIYE